MQSHPQTRGRYRGDSIGRIRAAAEGRAANAPGGQADRLTAVHELIREAQEYGADAIIELEFSIEGAALQRVAVTGIAVKFADAG